MLYILKMLLKRIKCKVIHLILRISALKWNLSIGSEKGERYSTALGNHGMTVIQQNSVMLKAKSRMYQLIWYCEDGELLMSS